MAKEFDLLRWREAIGRKIKMHCTQEMACNLLGFEDISSISKIERGIERVNRRVELLADALLNLPSARIKDRLNSTFARSK